MNGAEMKVDGLKVHFPMERSLKDMALRKPPRLVRAVDGVSFAVRKNEVLGLVGETGCGKSTIARTMLLMNPITEGEIVFQGVRVNDLHDKALLQYFSRVQMVWQDPFSCLNPRMKVGDIISRPLIRFRGYKKPQAMEKVREIIRIAGLNENELSHYPHEFSGGGRQRVVIARALVSEPSFLIADEPTSSLDVSIQAQILNLLKQLRESFDLTLLFISHNLAVIQFISTRIAVMYFGRIVEVMPKEDLFRKNYHWYTKRLIDAIPKGRRRVDTDIQEERSYTLNYRGCIYYHRCEQGRPRCLEQNPGLVELDKDHYVACHFPHDNTFQYKE